MTDFVEVNTADLVGAALDWAVAKAEGHQPLTMPMARVDYAVAVTTVDAEGKLTGFACRYSTEWSQGGPLIAKHRIDLTFDRDGLVFAYLCDQDGLELPSSNKWEAFGETHLIAACRAIVASVLGETVSVPKELLS
ncbi:phage protein NinX family protein [Pseudomonas viridiflava]|uniref:phage protein NinX family protein n=1 Tax=Pseudomonas viridiflava TaxID=33069 RepID=UPI000F01E6D0|nr:phage protein NinX family protein [Pseudomonas viridiflava]